MVFFSRLVFQSGIFSVALMSAASAFAIDSHQRVGAETLASASAVHPSAMTHASLAEKSQVAGANGPDGYVPATKYDNTPYRFNMNQNGKKMTAEEFDAWMKSRGIHVVKARPASGATEAPASGH